MPKVYNRHNGDVPTDAVYIGRPSKWGNPFVIGKDGTRSDVIAKYEKGFMANRALIAQIGELRGKDLVCYCAPRPCHGDVLLRVAARELARDGRQDKKAVELAGREQQIPEGTRIAIIGGAHYDDETYTSAALDRVRAKYPEMVVLHTGAPPGAIAWAKANNIPQVAVGSIEAVFAAKPIGVIALANSRDDAQAIDHEDAERARARGIAVWTVDPARQHAIAVARELAPDATRIEFAKPRERYCGLVIGKTATHIVQEIAARPRVVAIHELFRVVNADKALTSKVVEIDYPHGHAGLVREIERDRQLGYVRDHARQEIHHGDRET